MNEVETYLFKHDSIAWGLYKKIQGIIEHHNEQIKTEEDDTLRFGRKMLVNLLTRLLLGIEGDVNDRLLVKSQEDLTAQSNQRFDRVAEHNVPHVEAGLQWQDDDFMGLNQGGKK